ncbi:hypothetical protein BMS3Bbin07_01354 [bacterium BMS3Bbin07]|nr:hypothetical protein BMS3Bbin07_01354 [bacterium BMS3Bbin07]
MSDLLLTLGIIYALWILLQTILILPKTGLST